MTTTGTSHALEQIIKNSKEKLYLISPYVQLSPLLKGMLNQIDAKSLDLRLVYRDDIKEEDMAFLKSIKGIKLYSLENLHAKCYMNQDTAIVTSMNLFRYSQQNNHEMGIKINKATDPELYNELSKEVDFLIGQSKKYDKIADSVSTVIGFTKRTITAIQDAMAPGYCVRCGKEIEYNPDKPLCDHCYKSWAKFQDSKYEEKYCHSCGKKAKVTFAKPVCYGCYKKNAK